MPDRKEHAPHKYDRVRAAAVEALILIEQGEQADNAVRNVSSGRSFRPIDRRFLLQLVNGTTKMRRRLDHEIRYYLARPSTELPLILANILRLGFYQLRFTDRIPPPAAVSVGMDLWLELTAPNPSATGPARRRIKVPGFVRRVTDIGDWKSIIVIIMESELSPGLLFVNR